MPSGLFVSWVEDMPVLIKLKFIGNLVAMRSEGAVSAQVLFRCTSLFAVFVPALLLDWRLTLCPCHTNQK